MIYLDTSVILAHLLSEQARLEDRIPPEEIWAESLVTSRLTEYEIWTRINARRLAKSHGDLVGEILSRMAIVELHRPVLKRALEPFPVPVRTLDSLHLATIAFLSERAPKIRLASYDEKMTAAARACKYGLYPL